MNNKDLIFIEDDFIGNLNGYLTASKVVFNMVKEIFDLLDSKNIKYNYKFITDLSREFDDLRLEKIDIEELEYCYVNLIKAIKEGTPAKSYVSNIPRKNPYYWGDCFNKSFINRLNEKHYDKYKQEKGLIEHSLEDFEQKEDLIECPLNDFDKKIDKLIELKIEKKKQNIKENINFIKNNQVEKFLYINPTKLDMYYDRVFKSYSEILDNKYEDQVIDNLKDYDQLNILNKKINNIKRMLLNEKEYLKYLNIIQKIEILIEKKLISKENFENISKKYLLKNKRTNQKTSYLEYLDYVKKMYMRIDCYKQPTNPLKFNTMTTNQIVLNDENYITLQELFNNIVDYIINK